MAFRHAVLLLPAASLLHVLEEWPRFPRWARRFASDRYTDREYGIVHAVSLALALGSALLLSRFPGTWLLPALTALVIGPGMFWNGFFHLGATIVSRAYCAGVVTGLVLYLPLCALLGRQAVREGLVSPPLLASAVIVALVVHVTEVGHSVFKRW
jgi:Protein of unknown function with HXXEE motif